MTRTNTNELTPPTYSFAELDLALQNRLAVAVQMLGFDFVSIDTFVTSMGNMLVTLYDDRKGEEGRRFITDRIGQAYVYQTTGEAVVTSIDQRTGQLINVETKGTGMLFVELIRAITMYAEAQV